MVEKLKLSEEVPAAAAAISGDRRAGLGVACFGQVLVLYVGGLKRFGETNTRSFKGWFPKGNGSELWFSVREPSHLQLLDTCTEGTQLYFSGTLTVGKSKSGSTPYVTVRVELLEKV
jgi:hypothetical protein